MKYIIIALFASILSTSVFANNLPFEIDSLQYDYQSQDSKYNQDSDISEANTNQFNSQLASQTTNLVDYAKTLLGTPYRAGGATPSGFDCSGFMYYVFKNAGIDLPRSSKDMATVGQRITKSELQVGDMVFFAHSGTRINHVGMYVGNGKFIHSPSSGKTVEITALDGYYWKDRFITARRVAV